MTAKLIPHGSTAVLNDFRILSIHAHGKKKRKKLLSQDKGQKTEVGQFIEAILKGSSEVIPFDEIYNSSMVTFRIIESICTGECIKL